MCHIFLDLSVSNFWNNEVEFSQLLKMSPDLVFKWAQCFGDLLFLRDPFFCSVKSSEVDLRGRRRRKSTQKRKWEMKQTCRKEREREKMEGRKTAWPNFYFLSLRFGTLCTSLLFMLAKESRRLRRIIGRIFCIDNMTLANNGHPKVKSAA